MPEMQNGRHPSNRLTTAPVVSKTPTNDAETLMAPELFRPQNPSVAASVDEEDSTKVASSRATEPQAPSKTPVIIDAQDTLASPDVGAKKPRLPTSAVQDTLQVSSGHVAQVQVPPSVLLPTNDQCMALTDEQCFRLLELRDPKGEALNRNWALHHEPELVRLYMSMISFPQIEQRMRSKLDWPYRCYLDRFMERGFPIGQYERKTVVIELFRQISATLEESTPTSLAGGNPAKDTPGVPIEGPRGFPPSMKPLQTSPSLGNSDVPSQLSHTGTNTVVSGSPRPEHTQDNGTFGNPRAFVNPRTAPKPLLKAHGMQISPLEPPNHDPKVGLWNNNLRVIPCGTDHSKVLWQDETFTSCLVCGFTRWHSLMLHARSLPIATFEVALVSLQSSVRVDFAGNYPAHFLMSAGVGLGYFSLLFQFETDFDLDQNAFGQSPLHVLNPQDLEEELISFLEWCKPRKHPPGLLLTQRDIYGRTPIHTLIQYPLPVDLFRKILTVCPFVEHQLRCRDTSGQTIIMLMNKASLKLKSRSLSDYAKLQTCITEVKIFLSELENGKDTTSQRYGFQDIARGARGTSYLSYFQCRICHQINAHGNSYREQMVCACVFRRDRNAPDETGLTPAHALVTYARCNGDGIPETASQTAELFRILIPRGDPTLREALHVLSPYGESLVYNAAVRGFDELLSYVLELEIPERRRAMVNACIEEQNRQRSVLQAVDDKIKELVMQVKICEASRVANGELRKELVENYNRTVAVRHILLSNGAQFKPNVTTRWQICREESSQQNDSGQQLSTPKSDSGRGGSILNSDLSYDLSILDGESTYGTSTPVKESDLEPSIQESDSIYMASTLKNKSKHETVLQERASANEDILQDSSPCYGPSAQDSDSGYGASFQESISGYGHSIRESDSGCGSSIRDDTGAVAIQPAVGSHLQTNKESDKDGSQSCCGKQDIDIMSETPQTLESHKSRLDDLRSVISDLDEINSQAPTRRSPQEMLAEEHLAVLLAQHHDLQPLFRDALKVVDEERFVHNMRRLLKRFYMDLSQQAKTNLEHATIQLLRSRWSRIRLAQMIVEQLSPQKQEHTTRQISEIQLRVQDLEDWIASNAGLSSHLDNSLDINVPSPVGEVLEEEDTDEDSDVETEFEQPKPLPNIDEMESFLLCGNSFRNLSASICLFLLPASLASLTRVLMSIPHDHVWFSDEEDSSLMNKLKTIIEDATEENWNWWPLRPRMKTLQKEQTRVHWICHCRTHMWTELSKKYAEMYKMLLQNSTDSTKHNHLCRSRIPNHVKSEPTVLGRIAAACGIPTAPNTPYGSLPCGPQTPQRIRPGCPGAPGKSSNPADALNLEISTHQGVPVNVTASTINESFVLFGVQGCRRTLELAQINISPNTDDDVFFRNLKASYRKHRGFWRYWLSIWQMRYCDFVKFKKVDADRVIFHKRDLPHDMLYEYAPRPPDAELPPILPHEFELALAACSQGCPFASFHDCIGPRNGRFALDRIPKRKAALELNISTIEPAWGIQAQFSVSAALIIFYHFLVFAASFGFWGWWEAHHPGDLQNATVPLSVIAILLSLFWSSTGVLKPFRLPEYL